MKEITNDTPITKPVGTVYRIDGIYRTIIHREDDMAISVDDSGNHEILIIRATTKERMFPNGGVLPIGSEYLPSSSQFGKFGLTTGDYDRTMQIFCIIKKLRAEMDQVAIPVEWIEIFRKKS